MKKRNQYYDLVQAMEAVVAKAAWEQLNPFFAAGFTYLVGHLPPKKGVEGLKSHMQWQNQWVAWQGHETHLVAFQDDALIVEVTSIFRRLADGQGFKLPCTDIYRFDEQDKIYDWRVYADITPFGAKP